MYWWRWIAYILRHKRFSLILSDCDILRIRCALQSLLLGVRCICTNRIGSFVLTCKSRESRYIFFCTNCENAQWCNNITNKMVQLRLTVIHFVGFVVIVILTSNNQKEIEYSTLKHLVIRISNIIWRLVFFLL